jgi:hypothetical protein
MEVIRRRSRSFALRHLRMGHVRKGYRGGEAETFCRIVSPNGLVPFPVRECTGCADRRVPGAPAEASATGRRFGFVTTLSLQDKDENS